MIFGPSEYVQSAANAGNSLNSLGNVDLPHGDSLDGLTTTFKAFGSERGLIGKIDVLNNRLEGLGVETGEVGKATHKLYTAVMIGAGAFQVYNAVQSALKAKHTLEVALAAGETATYAAAQQWGNIALAGGAAAAVTAGFASGYYVAKSKDLSNPTERRKTIATVGGMING